MRAVRRCTIPLLTVALAGSALAGTARADDLSVLQAVSKQAKRISSDRDYKTVRSIRVHDAAQARRAIGPLTRVDRLLRSAARTVDKSSGSTGLGRTAKRDWVSGTRDFAYGYERLVDSCRALEDHRVGASNDSADQAVRAFRKAHTSLTKANRELATVSKRLGL